MRERIDLQVVQSESATAKPVAQRALGRQLVHNSAATVALYAITLLIAVWYTPFTVRHLGISLQAIVQLAASFVFYLSFATTGVCGSVGRLVMADAARGDMVAANRTFNTFLIAAERIALILLAIIGAIVVFVVPRFDFPPALLGTTRFLFAAVLGSAVIQLFGMCFDCAIWVSGRIDIRSVILTIEILVRSGTVFLLFNATSPSLIHIGIAILVAPLVSLALYYFTWRKFTPELTINRKYFDASRFKEIRGQGGWLLVFQIGTTLQFNADLFLLNLLLGSQIQGSYGLLVTWSNILRGLFGSMASLLATSLVAFQASDDREQLVSLALKGVRIQGMLIAIPIGVLCGLAGPALRWWVGPEFTFLAPIAWLILVPLVLEGSFNPVLVVIQAPGVISFSAKAAVAMGLVNIALGIILVKFAGLGMYGVALAVASTSVLRHGVVLPIYAARVMGQPWYVIVQQQAQIIIQLAVTGTLALYAAQFLHTRSFAQLFLAAIAAGSLASLVAILQLNAEERNRIAAIIRRR